MNPKSKAILLVVSFLLITAVGINSLVNIKSQTAATVRTDASKDGETLAGKTGGTKGLIGTPAGDVLYLMGGESMGTSVTYFNDVYSSVDGLSWNQKTPVAPWWSQRSEMSGVFFNNELWVMGGQISPPSIEELWSSPDGITWTQKSNLPHLGPQDYALLVTMNGNLYVIEGNNMPGQGAVWSSPDGVVWTKIVTNAPWSTRIGFSATVFRNEIYIMGGQNNSTYAYLNDIWKSPDGISWSQVIAAGANSPNAPWDDRYEHEALVFENELWLMGGYHCTSVPSLWCDDIWKSPDGVNWTQVGTLPWPSFRNEFRAVVFSGQIILTGGQYSGTGMSTNDSWLSSDGINWTQDATNPWAIRDRHLLIVAHYAPDLQITKISSPKFISRTQINGPFTPGVPPYPVQLNITIKNTGNADAVLPATTKLLYQMVYDKTSVAANHGPTCASCPSPLPYLTLGTPLTLHPGDTYSFDTDTQFMWQAPMTLGSYHFSAFIDWPGMGGPTAGLVEESNEGNNSFSQPVTVVP